MTKEQQKAIADAAQDWTAAKVPYLWGGMTKKGADCSGSVSGIYADANINIGHKTSGEFATCGLFYKASGTPEVGDVGVFPSHVVLYAGDTNAGFDVWSATHTGGNPFGPAKSSWFGKPTWYRYVTPTPEKK